MRRRCPPSFALSACSSVASRSSASTATASVCTAPRCYKLTSISYRMRRTWSVTCTDAAAASAVSGLEEQYTTAAGGRCLGGRAEGGGLVRGAVGESMATVNSDCPVEHWRSFIQIRMQPGLIMFIGTQTKGWCPLLVIV